MVKAVKNWITEVNAAKHLRNEMKVQRLEEVILTSKVEEETSTNDHLAERKRFYVSLQRSEEEIV